MILKMLREQIANNGVLLQGRYGSATKNKGVKVKIKK